MWYHKIPIVIMYKIYLDMTWDLPHILAPIPTLIQPFPPSCPFLFISVVDCKDGPNFLPLCIHGRSLPLSASVSVSVNLDHVWSPLQCEPSTDLPQRHQGRRGFRKGWVWGAGEGGGAAQVHSGELSLKPGPSERPASFSWDRAIATMY